MEIEKYSIGVGDRFGAEGVAQLRALQKAEALLVTVVPVWNKSNREHSIIGTVPDDTRRCADAAVRTCRWNHPYHVDADHIGLVTVDRFLASSDFFTIDVADWIGRPAHAAEAEAFVAAMAPVTGRIEIPGIPEPLTITRDRLLAFARTYLAAVQEAGRVYRHIAAKKGEGGFIPEVSMDEAEAPQNPVDLLLILGALAHERVPVQTIAPKFTGSFLKGVEYVGPVERFATEFEQDLAVVKFAVEQFHLPGVLKLSIHSGSDKFSLYPVIRRAIRRQNAGLHLKTAGTTWLEEVIGLAAAGGEGLAIARDLYDAAWARFEELCGPYRTVIDIDRERLPAPAGVRGLSAGDFAATLRHDPACPLYSRDVRQLVHVAYKVAAEMGERFTRQLAECRESIATNVTANIFQRHLQPLFLAEDPGAGGRTAAPAAPATHAS